jgi:hypothetical protein
VEEIPEDKKGHVKITIEAEINEPLMEMLKNSMENMPHMMQQVMAQRKKD